MCFYSRGLSEILKRKIRYLFGNIFEVFRGCRLFIIYGGGFNRFRGLFFDFEGLEEVDNFG